MLLVLVFCDYEDGILLFAERLEIDTASNFKKKSENEVLKRPIFNPLVFTKYDIIPGIPQALK